MPFFSSTSSTVNSNQGIEAHIGGDQSASEKYSPSPLHSRRRFRWLVRPVVFLVCLILAGTIFESVAEAADIQAYSPPGQMVDVGGFRMHLNCTGTGSPTVIIEAGLGAWSLEWSAIQAEIAKTTRVCTYDRAGMGYSEAGPLPRNAEQFALELHTLLERANVPAPYVIAGHSLGGLPVRIFAHHYPADVAGVVLIDSMSPGQLTQPPSQTESLTPVQSGGSPLPALLARIGLVRLLAGQLITQGLPAHIQPAYTAFSVTPRSVQAWSDEGAGLQQSLAQAGAIRTLGSIPLIVLTAGLNQQTGWQTMQVEMLQLSSSSQQIIVENSGHNIQIEQPEAAVAAILQMVSQLR